MAPLQSGAPKIPALYVRGMHGLGDAIHQRALLRQWIDQGREIYMENSWVSIYWDLLPRNVKIVKGLTTLRVQLKNQQREDALFFKGPVPGAREVMPVWYQARDVNSTGSVLAAMCKTTKCNPDIADFRMPIRNDWRLWITKALSSWTITKPIMVYRPLVQRLDWGGCSARNPSFLAYSELFESIRDRFFVISIADLEERREWLAGPPFDADLCLHKGELNSEHMATLFHEASLVFASPGFAIPMAQAVGTPSVCVFGGFETGTSFSLGAKFTPHLPIEPIKPCGCWQHRHNCDKTIDMPKALERLGKFVDDILAASKARVA